MNAQQIIDNCDNYNFNQRNFRKEMNISFLINDVVKQFKKQDNIIEKEEKLL